MGVVVWFRHPRGVTVEREVSCLRYTYIHTHTHTHTFSDIPPLSLLPLTLNLFSHVSHCLSLSLPIPSVFISLPLPLSLPPSPPLLAFTRHLSLFSEASGVLSCHTHCAHGTHSFQCRPEVQGHPARSRVSLSSTGLLCKTLCQNSNSRTVVLTASGRQTCDNGMIRLDKHKSIFETDERLC